MDDTCAVLRERSMRLLLVIALAAPAVAEPLAAQDATRWSFSGQVRHRTEIDSRAFAEDSETFAFHLLRTRLGVAAQPLPNVGAFVQVQDARLFGGEDPAFARGTMDGTADALDLHQAYFVVGDIFASGLDLKVGRQELVYGNQRLIGAVNWSNVGRSFDAAVATYERESARVDLFAAKLVDAAAMRAPAQNFVGVYATLTPRRDHLLDLFFLTDNDTQQEAVAGEERWRLERYTPGFYARGAFGALDYSAEGIYQFGHTVAGNGWADIRAYLASGTLGYLLVRQRDLRLALTYTRLSGDDDPTDGTWNTFNTLFATNHKFYGYMDYYPFNDALFPYGLQDAIVSLSTDVGRGLRLYLDVHHLMAASEPSLRGAGIHEDVSTYGQEIDLAGQYRYNEHFGIGAGASAFVPGSFVEHVLGDETTWWLYLTTMVTL